ncbi:cell division protein ZapE [Catenovulum maritimum]|uniref:Cell division protein ZapE n=1 Tax=Catenovulum maritimum TaxID=1513271 RepID=A0A0J8JKN8_9ALTE|nr:cell division protein ZapE [Catenovulum maritimum]KMT65036.1 ATPase [Catenovulum maritimum]
MTTPFILYQQDLSANKLVPDPAQENAIRKLDNLHQNLVNSSTVQQNWLVKFKYLFSQAKNQAPTGLYFWGGVGRGKTYMMDLFYHSLPFDNKMRIHFHRFMHRVHDELKHYTGEINPLEKVADKLAQETKVICFDEFFVSDITDAMLLGGLIHALFERGIVLVATSNIEPSGLYKNGLQRARFIPAITAIENNCEVVNVDSGIDYRLRTLTQAEIFHFPADKEADENLISYFNQLASSEDIEQNISIEIENRMIPVRYMTEGVILIEFDALCNGPRSQSDYIEISRCYHSVLVSNVYQMGAGKDDVARRFIAMVDEFYERKVKLIISSEIAMEKLYTDGLLNFEFKRCLSRLQEMQSHDYLAEPHLA